MRIVQAIAIYVVWFFALTSGAWAGKAYNGCRAPHRRHASFASFSLFAAEYSASRRHFADAYKAL